MEPTPEQAAFIEAAQGDESIMGEALAGVGKTKTLEMMTPLLGAKGRRPSSVLAVAFNKKIKEELAERLPTSIPGGGAVKVQTLNGLGHGTWWKFTKKNLDLAGNKTWQMLKAETEAQNLRLSKEEWQDVTALITAAKAIGFVPKGSPLPGTPLFRDNPEGVEAVFEWADIDYREDLEVIFRATLVRSLKALFVGGLIDFNDQIYAPVVFNATFQKYDTVIVDEAQDLSKLNHIMIERSCARRMIVMGDPHQAIYAFRGAESNSMELLAAKREFIHLPLTMTFRCSQAIVRRAQFFVPEYRAAPSNIEGAVIEYPESLARKSWSAGDIPPDCAIICRNNAPIIKLAFKLIRQGRGICVLGTDLGKALERALDQATKKTPPTTSSAVVAPLVDQWFEREINKAKTPRRKDSLQDRWECVRAIVDNSADLASAKRTCHSLFENPHAVVTLSSGHKSKGLEWKTVIHLDPWRIPSQYCTGDEELRQEDNLRYVIETRAKETLILADLESFV